MFAFTLLCERWILVKLTRRSEGAEMRLLRTLTIKGRLIIILLHNEGTIRVGYVMAVSDTLGRSVKTRKWPA
jgi:hypothetical protein